MMSWLPTIAAHAGRSGRGRRRSICTVGQGIWRRSCRVIPIRHPQRPRRKDGQYGISSSPGRPGPKWSGKLAGGERCQRYPKDRPRRRHVYDVKWKDPAHPVAAGLEPSLTTSDDSISASSSHEDPHPRHRLQCQGRGSSGTDEPLIWTNTYGKGRVFHTALDRMSFAVAQGFIDSFAAESSGRRAQP